MIGLAQNGIVKRFTGLGPKSFLWSRLVSCLPWRHPILSFLGSFYLFLVSDAAHNISLQKHCSVRQAPPPIGLHQKDIAAHQRIQRPSQFKCATMCSQHAASEFDSSCKTLRDSARHVRNHRKML